MKRIYFLIVASLLCAGAAVAQPRPIDRSAPSQAPSSQLPSSPQLVSAPASFVAKYEGGMFGFSEKELGTLKFEDENERLVFFGKDQKEKFHIPYDAILVIYPQSKSVTSTAGHVVRNLPLPGAVLGGLIKEKRRYLIVHFEDPDIEAARGLVNFKLEGKELLDAVMQRLAGKANLAQRGDAYYRPNKTQKL